MRGTVVLVIVLAACVERRLQIRTDPPGAVVHVNGREVGTSPVAWRFHHYGTVLVEAYLEGHEPEQRVVKLKTPPYQRPVADFFTDVVYPGTIHDDHHLRLRLRPLRELTEARVSRELEEIESAARNLRAEAQRK